MGNGRDIWFKLIKPRAENEATLTAQALLKLWAQGRVEEGATAQVGWEGVDATVTFGKYDKQKRDVLKGEILIHWGAEQTGDSFKWQWYLPAQGGVSQSEFVVTRTGQGSKNARPRLLKASELSWTKFQSLSLEFIRQQEQDTWQRQISRFAAGLDYFQPLHMEQSVQNLADSWDDFWPAMAYAYVTAPAFAPESAKGKEETAGRSLQDWRKSQSEFLRAQADKHTQYSSLSERIVRTVLDMLKQGDPDLESVRRILERTRELGLKVNWWPVQNRLWQLRAVSTQVKQLAELVDMRL